MIASLSVTTDRTRGVVTRALATFGWLVFYRVGFQIPLPFTALDYAVDPRSASPALGFLSFLSGGALGSTTLFALGLLPYLAACAGERITGKRGARGTAAVGCAVAAILFVYVIPLAGHPNFLEPGARSNPFVAIGIIALTLLAGSAAVTWIAGRLDRVWPGYGAIIVVAANMVALAGHAVFVVTGTENALSTLALLLTIWLAAVALAWLLLRWILPKPARI